jgi:rod shape-determining protein MreC
MKKRKFSIQSKHLIIIMTIFCIGLITLTALSSFSFSPIKNRVEYVISPFQNGINTVGTWFTSQTAALNDAKQLTVDNMELTQKIDELMAENNVLLQEKDELDRLRKLYDLDKSYSEYEKVAAQIISKDPGNWYNSFTINRGRVDGIEVDHNVLAIGGLVGIVTDVGENTATVRSIIDDASNVSAMSAATSTHCIVTGNLLLMDEGKLNFIQMTDEDDNVQAGERIVTSDISDKFLKGILIGHISDIEYDHNNLTKTGTIIPAVDFEHLNEVLVITELKQKG